MFWNTGVTRTNSNKLLLILAIMLSTMLLPSIEIRSSLPRLRLDDVLIFGVFALNIILWLIHRTPSEYDLGLSYHEEKSRGIRAITTVFLLLLGAMIVSNIFARIFLKTPFGLRDAMEGVTLAKYYLAATLAISLDLQDGEFSLLRNTFLVSFGFIILLSWGQFLNIANVNAWLTPFFAQSHLDNLVNANPPRVLGTFDNPNVMGIFSVITLAIFVALFYFRNNERSKTIFLFAAVGLTIKLVFMTISRTALLGTAFVLTLLSLWALFKHRWKKDMLIKVGALFVLTLLIFFTSPRGFTTRINEATNFDTSTSAQGHLLRAGNAFGYIKESPILGWGTAKTTMTTLVDDEYALITRRYGVIGLAMYLWLFLRPLKGALGKVRLFDFSSPDQGLRETKTLLSIAYVAATGAIFIYNITAGIFYNLQLMTFFALFMGLIYRIEGEND
ncbi:O-antigen ligase family protein [Desulfosporosinus sp. FKB]|uniref:O-antigen ligase family protein n=1 Tax=Desulfosporosinus sp. FKB TaxID=1969835 RepID=UPI000B49CB75|nr:O-antigen ligase family protein [Desulfosporosinus sp. FKB]